MNIYWPCNNPSRCNRDQSIQSKPDRKSHRVPFIDALQSTGHPFSTQVRLLMPIHPAAHAPLTVPSAYMWRRRPHRREAIAWSEGICQFNPASGATWLAQMRFAAEAVAEAPTEPFRTLSPPSTPCSPPVASAQRMSTHRQREPCHQIGQIIHHDLWGASASRLPEETEWRERGQWPQGAEAAVGDAERESDVVAAAATVAGEVTTSGPVPTITKRACTKREPPGRIHVCVGMWDGDSQSLDATQSEFDLVRMFAGTSPEHTSRVAPCAVGAPLQSGSCEWSSILCQQRMRLRGDG